VPEIANVNVPSYLISASASSGTRQHRRTGRSETTVFSWGSVTTGESLIANTTWYRYEPGCGHDEEQERVNGALEVVTRNLSVVKG
jgi:hypothetical protein